MIIQTTYNGYRFRSRLEAKWAVFFDAMGVKYEYEKEGYKLKTGPYLPDFYLPDLNAWAEVKPESLSEHEYNLCEELVLETNKEMFLLVGEPDYKQYKFIMPCGTTTNEYDIRLDTSLIIRRTYFVNDSGDNSESCFSSDYKRAIDAVRGARFEHGEKPLIKIEHDPR